MARNKTLLKLLNDVRAEARLSLAPAHNVQTRDSHIMMIQREQERLWEDFDWPHLQVERLIPLQAGQRYYEPPEDMIIDRIQQIQLRSDAAWCPLTPMVGALQYTVHESSLDERAWPPRRWRIAENDQIEVWPTPDQNSVELDQNGYLKVIGIRNLRPLVADDDRADLDDRLITLYVAGAILAATGAKDANIKLEAAKLHYDRLKGSLVKQTRFRMFGVGERRYPTRPYISRYRPPE